MNKPMNFRTIDAPICKLGEGPTFDPHSQTAWWFDILQQKLFEYRLADEKLTQHDLPFTASALARIDAERQLLHTDKGLYIRNINTGELSFHLALEADRPDLRCNDARVHPSGAFWLGTMGWNAETGAGSIYHYRAGELRRLYEDISISNAICFSSDGATAYYADTGRGKVMRVAVDPQNGLPTAEPELFLNEFPAGAGPDGAVIDDEGNIWIALWGGSQVAGYTPRGEALNSIPLPASQPSCPAFIGPDARQMLVTSAAVDVDKSDQKDQSGKIFIVDLPFKGRFDPDVLIG